MVTAVFATDSLDSARAFLALPDLEETMRAAGVVSAPEVFLTNDA